MMTTVEAWGHYRLTPSYEAMMLPRHIALMAVNRKAKMLKIELHLLLHG